MVEQAHIYNVAILKGISNLVVGFKGHTTMEFLLLQLGDLLNTWLSSCVGFLCDSNSAPRLYICTSLNANKMTS